ncbi:MAG: hypothetical protein KDD61_14250 [Bdellovibrionales bacterium]|nr:hypothetical protein [Bdellovibrionales bacterium]
MKLFIIIYITLAAFLLSHDGMAAPTKTQQPVTFTYKAADMELNTTGETIHKAREIASEQCFNKRMREFREARHQEPSEDQALMIIDSCVNI